MPKSRQKPNNDTTRIVERASRLAVREEIHSPAARTARIKSGLAGVPPRFSSPTPAQKAVIAKKTAKDRWK